MAIAGRVAMIPKGDYDSATTYQNLDVVRYENDIYVAKKASTGVLPTNTDYWMLCMENVTQEQYDALVNGTTPAGNALKLNGKDANEYMKFVGTVDASFINGYERANPYIAHVSSPTAVELGLPSDYHKILNIPDNADGYATQIAFPANDFTIVPHYRHCGSGIWHDWKVFGDGCNAMTLNGLTADNFAKYNPNLIKTADGLIALFEVSENGIFFGEASEVTIESVGLSYARGSYIIQKDNKYGNITFIGNGVLVIRQLINGNWQIWKRGAYTADLANKLPLDGSVPMTGNNLFIANGYGGQYADHNSIQIASKNTPNGNTCRFLEIKNSNYDSNVNTALLFRDMVNGVITDYDILHTGNSLKVQASNDAPTDANTMWYDTANKTWKRYVDGAWQA